VHFQGDARGVHHQDMDRLMPNLSLVLAGLVTFTAPHAGSDFVAVGDPIDQQVLSPLAKCRCNHELKDLISHVNGSWSYDYATPREVGNVLRLEH
jgi:hypothetical protein